MNNNEFIDAMKYSINLIKDGETRSNVLNYK